MSTKEDENERQELENADDISESEGDAEESEGSSYVDEESVDEESVDEDDEDNDPQFLIKHKKHVPDVPEGAKCLICGKLKPAFFGDCRHYYCCFQCYQENYTAAAKGTQYTVGAACETCGKDTSNYYYRPGAIEEEDAWRVANQPKKRKRFTCVDTFEGGEGFVSPKLTQCVIVVDGMRCKQAGYYLADHGCYTEICRGHESELDNACPKCGKDVFYYHKNERAPLPKGLVSVSKKK